MNNPILCITIFCLLAGASRIHAEDSLVASWNFNENTGDTVRDGSGNGNHGKICGATWVSGFSGGSALNFDGVDDSVLVRDLGVDSNEPRTAMLWFKTAVDENSQLLWASLINIGGDGAARRAWVIDVRNEDGSCTGYPSRRITGHYFQSSTCSERTLTSIGIDGWHHVALTNSGTFQVLYLDGDSIGKSIITSLNTAPGPTKIGARPGLGGYFNGIIDEVRIYNRCLTTEEIRTQFNAYQGTAPEIIAIQTPTLEQKPLFQWYAVPGALTYTIQIDISQAFGSPLTTISTSDTFFQQLVNLPIDTIYWHVKSDQSMLYSATSSFVIQDSTIPILVPYTPNPTQVRRPVLRWHAVAEAASYQVLVDTDSVFSSPEVSISVADTLFQPLSNLPSGMIYWKVKSDLNAAFSGTGSFYITPDTIPFLYAFNGSETLERRPLFRWGLVTRAIQYRIQIDTSRIFLSPGVSLDVSDTTFTPLSNLNYTQYFWRVSCDLNTAAYSPVDSVAVVLSSGREKNVKLVTDGMTVSPNPFNPSATIRFRNQNRNAAIRIFSVNGIVVYAQQGVREGLVTWNATGQPSGVYIVEVFAEGRAISSRICLMK